MKRKIEFARRNYKHRLKYTRTTEVTQWIHASVKPYARMIISSRSVYSVHRPLSIDRLLRDELKTRFFSLRFNYLSTTFLRRFRDSDRYNSRSIFHRMFLFLSSLSIFFFLSSFHVTKYKREKKTKKEGRTGRKSRLHTHQRTLYSNANGEGWRSLSLSLSLCSMKSNKRDERERKRIGRSNYARFKEDGRDDLTSKLKYQVRVR